jgi:hypothetical protein
MRFLHLPYMLQTMTYSFNVSGVNSPAYHHKKKRIRDTAGPYGISAALLALYHQVSALLHHWLPPMLIIYCFVKYISRLSLVEIPFSLITLII